MVPDSELDPTPSHPLAPLLPEGVLPSAFFASEALNAFDARWRELESLGFTLEVREHNLRVLHRDRGLDFVTQFSDQDDLGLFAALKATFGGFWDRFGWLMQPSRAVTVPYEHLKAVLGVCQTARLRLRRIK